MRQECRGRFPRHWLQRKPLVSDSGMHHVLWGMSGSLTRGGGEMFPAFPVHAQPAILRIWQEARATYVQEGKVHFHWRMEMGSEWQVFDTQSHNIRVQDQVPLTEEMYFKIYICI